MTTHNSVAICWNDLYSRIFDDTDTRWDEVIGCEETDVNEFDGTWWTVSWPQHVGTPRYNGDAMYSGPMTEAEARADADEVHE